MRRPSAWLLPFDLKARDYALHIALPGAPRNQTPALPAKLPAPLEEQFKKQTTAWENFRRFTHSYQEMTIGWVASAKQEQTRLRRLRQLIAESAANKRIKFM